MQCEVCGNEYANAFIIVRNEERFVFDCFECAIHALAPTCAHCGCKIVGHGVDRDQEIFCCDHCLRRSGGEVADDDEVALEVDEAADDEADEDDELDNIEFEDEDSEDLTTTPAGGAVRARRR